MSVDSLRRICLAFPGVTEDVKWGQDLCFCVGGKMLAAVNLELPHQLSFKCTPETFAELIEREGIIPAPYLARAMWVQESALNTVLERQELEPLLRASYDLVLATLPRSKRPGTSPERAVNKSSRTSKPKPKPKARPKARAKPRRAAHRQQAVSGD